MSLSQVQKWAAQTVIAVAKGKNLSDELEGILLANSDLSAQDKGMLQDIAYGVQRHGGSLRFMLGKLLNKPLNHAELESLLLVALYQLNHTRNAPHAVVNEAVNHIAKIGRGQFRSFANAVLRRFLREREKLNAQCKYDETAKCNLPQWWIAYLKNVYPKHWHNIVNAFQSRPPLTLRVNRRCTNAEQYAAELKQANLECKILGEYAVRVLTPVPVSQLPGFAQGRVSVQDYGAQMAAQLLDVQAGERVLDACAAPGGKSGHLLEWADIELTALDIDAKRLARVQSNVERLGFQATLHCAAAENQTLWYDGNQFDAVLADVPCTASGTVKRNPDIRWLRRPKDALKTASQQEALLDALWETVRDGGRMLLATCSLFNEENELQTQKFLKRHSNAVLRAEHMILPSDKQDGFYYALIGKMD